MQKNSYNYDELISCGEGKLFGEGNAKLPLPPMLMFDRITEIKKDTGEFKKGFIKAELDIKDNLWFFNCHFKKDPVMPGCLGLDAMWQLVGFYLGWIGEPGKGRALGVNSVKFTGEVLKNVNFILESFLGLVFITLFYLIFKNINILKKYLIKLNSLILFLGTLTVLELIKLYVFAYNVGIITRQRINPFIFVFIIFFIIKSSKSHTKISQ